MQMKKINILGTTYEVYFGTESEFPNLKENDGYTDTSSKDIIVNDMSNHRDDVLAKKNLPVYQKQVLRHEIIHAFLAESGLDGCGSSPVHWEFNEEMVDWLAIQSPKIFKVFQELEIL